MLERNSESRGVKEILASILEQRRNFLLEKMTPLKENKILRELAKDLAYKMLEEIGYDFKFYPTPIPELAGFLNIKEEKSNKVLGDAELYKKGNDWTVIHRDGIVSERKRFSLAHEIGHVLLSYVTEYLSTLDQYRIENFCNMIAAELLAPSYIFENSSLDEVLKDVAKSGNEIETPKELPRLNFAIFELMRKHLLVSRFVLVQQLHWTKFLDDCETGIIISAESVNRFTGRTPALRTIYIASPTWGFIPTNMRLKNMGLFSALPAFNRLRSWESEKWRETIKVKEKKARKWLSTSIESYGEHVVPYFTKNNKYMVTTLSWKK